MLFLEITIDVKFRAFGIDWGKTHEHAILPIPNVPVSIPPRVLWTVNRNGVTATLAIVAGPPAV